MSDEIGVTLLVLWFMFPFAGIYILFMGYGNLKYYLNDRDRVKGCLFTLIGGGMILLWVIAPWLIA